MSQRTDEVINCDHEIAEIVTDETTEDEVLACDECGEVLDVHENVLPQHWFDHMPRVSNDTPHTVKLSADVLSGDLFENRDSRFIHICGSCGHWIGAVHAKWFDSFDSERQIVNSESAFVSGLRESLCPECGSACFRHGSLVAPLETAHRLRRYCDATRYIFNRADDLVWNGEEALHQHMEGELFDHGFFARCPACGFAEQYGDYEREFDFHHWDYENEIGCRLCRECHTHIHDGMKAREQTQKQNARGSTTLCHGYMTYQ